MLGEIYEGKTALSLYQPSPAVAEFTAHEKANFSLGVDILNRSWTELNYYSVIERMNKDQRMFNALVDESVDNPEESWKWRGTRSMARKKAIEMHAQLTANYIVPEITALNDDNTEDREMSDIMENIVEWMTMPGNSNYQPAFLLATMGMLINPVTFLGADYIEVMQKIKEKGADGSYSQKEILDEVLSGFQAQVYSANQIMITNAHEQNIQKQRRVIKRRYIDYTEARARWKDHPNWGFVQPGIKTVFNEATGLFYDVRDLVNTNLVEEATVMGRRDDLEVCFVNGIYMGDENIDDNPMSHRNNNNAPTVPFVPFGYHRINEHFFYFKSLINIVGWDSSLYDAMSEIVMNRALLEQNMPVAVTGADEVDTGIIFPGAAIAFKDPQTRITPILPPANFGAGFNALNETDKSMSEESISPLMAGQMPQTRQTAYVMQQVTAAAKVMLQEVGKTLGASIVEFGNLMIDIALTHLTVAQVEELGGDQTKLKYRSFVLNDKTVHGKSVSKRIVFDDSMLGTTMSQQQKDEQSVKMLTDLGYPNNKEHLYRVNPELFARRKYLSRMDPKTMFEKNDETRQAMLSSFYTLVRKDPMIEPEALVRKLTYAYFRSEGDELVSKNSGIAGQIMGAGQNTPQPTPEATAGKIATTKAVSTALAPMGGTRI